MKEFTLCRYLSTRNVQSYFYFFKEWNFIHSLKLRSGFFLCHCLYNQERYMGNRKSLDECNTREINCGTKIRLKAVETLGINLHLFGGLAVSRKYLGRCIEPYLCHIPFQRFKNVHAPSKIIKILVPTGKRRRRIFSSALSKNILETSHN